MESLFAAECAETVSILYAIVFGADGACVLISAWSLLTAFAAFMVLVVIAQFFARKLWARLTRPTPRPAAQDDTPRGAITDDPNYANSAIRSSRR